MVENASSENESGGEESGSSEEQGNAKGGGGKEKAGTGTTGMIPESELPEEMRGKSPEQVNAMWNAAARALESEHKANETMRDEIQQMRSRLEEMSTPAPAPTPDYDPEKLKDEIYEDPDGAIEKVVRAKFGSLIDRLERSSGETAILRMRNQLGEDFAEHEESVRAMIASTAGPVDDKQVYGAYLMARGKKAIDDDNERKKKSASQPETTPEVPESEVPQLSSLQKNVARSLGMSEEEFLENLEGQSQELGI